MKEEQNGLWKAYKRVPLQIKNPITCRKVDEDRYALADSDGVERLQVTGSELARQVCGLLEWMADLKVLY